MDYASGGSLAIRVCSVDSTKGILRRASNIRESIPVQSLGSTSAFWKRRSLIFFFRTDDGYLRLLRSFHFA